MATKASVSRPNQSQKAYLPATPSGVRCCEFSWKHYARAAYTVADGGRKLTHRGGGGDLQYLPAVGDLAMPPNTGKYFYQFRINTDNARLGVCTASAYPDDAALGRYEIGRGACEATETEAERSQPGSPTYLQTIGAVTKPEDAFVALFHPQTSQTTVNGAPAGKQLWREFVPVSGALFSFVVDTDEGVVQMFVDKLYAGTVFGEAAGLRGRTLYPCVGLAGMDSHNRSIGTGMTSAVVAETKKFDCIY